MQAKVLVQLLRGKGFDVQTVSEAGLTSMSDADVLDYARANGRVLLTRNARDFQALHEANGQHPGILVEYQDADPLKNMSYVQIANAVAKIVASGWDIQGQLVSINLWR